MEDFYAYRFGEQYKLMNVSENKYYIINSEGFNFFKNYLNRNITRALSADEKAFISEIEGDTFSDTRDVLPDYKKKIFHIQWHITGLCNLRCKHCYQEKYTTNLDLSLEGLKKVFDNYCDLIDSYEMLPEISITGGEPLSSPYIFDLLNYIRSKKSETHLNLLTNGTLIDDKMCEKLIENHVYGVQISLDGYNAVTHDLIRGAGNFQKTVSAIGKLHKYGISVAVHCVLFASNIDYLENYVKFCIQNHVDKLTFSRYVPFGGSTKNHIQMLSPLRMREVYQQIYDLSQKYPEANINLGRDFWQLIDCSCGSVCPVGDCTLTILNDGTVLPCRRLPLFMGNAFSEKLTLIIFRSKIWEKMQNNTVLQCKGCDHITTCKAGCQGIAYTYFGELMEKADPQCWLLRDMLPLPQDNHDEYNEQQGYYTLDSNKSIYENEL